MKKLTSKGIFIDLNKDYCTSKDDVLNSEILLLLLERFINKIEKKKISYYQNLIKYFDSKNQLIKEIIMVCKLCLIFPFKDTISTFIMEKESFLEFIEEFYNYYRKFERYSFLLVNNDSIEVTRTYLEIDNKFNNLILDLYRSIEENIKEEHNLVYRQLNAGSNVSFLLEKGK